MSFINLLKEILEEKRINIERLPRDIERAKEDVKRAQSFGDVRENYDLVLAKERRMLYSKRLKTDQNWVTECEDYFKKYSNDSEDSSTETITIGTKINAIITDKSGIDLKAVLYIVPKSISFSSRGLMSDTCPAGKALMGRRAGDVVDVVIGVSTVKYKIESIG